MKMAFVIDLRIPIGIDLFGRIRDCELYIGDHTRLVDTASRKVNRKPFLEFLKYGVP